jgi:hypothetical protein
MHKINTILILKIFLSLLLFLWALPFLISPVYNFPEPTPFSGDKVWNPYQNLDSSGWKKGNFQIQSLAWGGLTDGSKNPTDSIYSIYEKLGYQVIGISDYMKINTYSKDHSGYMSIYEHGYNFRKTHQVSLGAKEVYWLDFPFYQTTSQKQFIINQLLPRTQILALVHPAFSLEGYSHRDLQLLTGYHLIEALNHQIYSLSHWDAALSAGKAKFILADDDAHDISNPFLVGVEATLIQSQSQHPDSIIEAMKQGKSYGLSIYTPDNENYTLKAERSKSLPKLLSAKIENGVFTVLTDKVAEEIRFIGQQGEVKRRKPNTGGAQYLITKDDSYIRTEIDFGRGEVMYLNPIFRFESENPLEETPAEISIFKSIVMYLFSWSLFLFIMRALWHWRK